MRAATLFFSLTLLAVGCSRDLTVPPPPVRGGLVGTLDTSSGKLSAEARDVVLTDADGAARTATTDAAGAFAFSDLLPGVYFLSIEVPGYTPVFRPALRVTSGAPKDLGTLALAWQGNSPAEGTLRGLVSAPGGGDVSGALVEFILGGSPIGSATTARDGAFAQRLPPGRYAVRASHPNFVTAELLDVDLPEGEVRDISSTPVLLDLNPATLSGRVLRERDQAAAVPAVGATVTLKTGQTTVVDTAGNFQLTGLAAGTTSVTVALAGHVDAQGERLVQLTPGAQSDLGTLSLLLVRGAVTGTVKLSDNSPVAGTTVSLVGTSYSAVVSPDSSDPSLGVFGIAGVPAGSYQVAATRERYSRATAAAVVTTGPVDVGQLTLTLLQGDFDIEDADPDNLPRHTRTRGVTLRFTGFPSTGVASYRASEDATFGAGADAWLPYTGITQPFTLSDLDGSRTVYAQYRDGNGTASQVFASSVVLDRALPVVNAASFQATGAVGAVKFTRLSSAIPFTLVATDSGSGVARMRLGEAVDGSGNVTATPVTYAAATTFSPASTLDGLKTVWVQVIDNAGNVSLAAQDTVTVDTARPTGSLAIAQGARAEVAGFTDTPLVTLAFTTTPEPNGGALLVRVANATGTALDSATHQPVQAQQSHFLSPTPDGLRTVYAVLRDAAGNESLAPMSGTITLDTTPPTPASASLLGSTPTRTPLVTVVLTTNAADLAPVNAITVSEDAVFSGAGTVGPLPLPGNARVDYTLQGGDGPRSVYVRFRDRAGNESFAAVPVALDRVAPTGTLSLTGALADGTPSEAVTAVNQVAVQLSVAGASEYVLGNESMSSCPATGWAALPASGLLPAHTLTGAASPRQVRGCFRDDAGNTLGPLVDSIALDTSTPSGCTLSLQGTRADGPAAAPAGKTGKPAITATIAGCSETPAEVFLTTAATVTCAAAGNPWGPYAASQPVVLSGADGAWTVRGCVRDAARNAATLVTATITLDTTPPEAVSVSLNGGAAYLNAADVVAQAGAYRVTVTGNAAAGTAAQWAFAESTAGLTNFTAYPATNPGTLVLGGTGARSVYAVFRDDVGNLSSVAEDGITVDVTAPASGALAIASPTGNGFVNSVSAVVTVTAPADAQQMELIQTPSAACSAASFAGATPRPVVQDTTFLLTPGDGTKYLCVRFFDEALNPSAPVTASTVLDATPPTQPQITTSPTTVALAAGTFYPVQLLQPVTEANFARYEIVGGQTTAWTSASTVRTTTSFNFRIAASGAAPAGIANTLKVRAVDHAGNVSSEDSVTIVNDIVSPQRASMNAAWVDNGNGMATLWWAKSPDADVRWYKVHYSAVSGGGNPANYQGTGALQGPSPVLVPATSDAYQSTSLGGLQNSGSTFVTVTPMDAAGNEGPSPSTTAEVTLSPGEVSPSLVGTVSIPGFGTTTNIQVVDHYAVLVSNENACPTPGAVQLAVLDLSNFATPFQGGTIDPAAPQPTVAFGPVSLMPGACNQGFTENAAVAMQWPYLFIGAGPSLRIYNLLTPSAPALEANLTFGALNILHLNVVGLRLFMGGGTTLSALDLSKLYDQSAATKPGVSDLIGTVTWAYTSGAKAAVTRDRLVQMPTSGSVWSNWATDSALDSNPATPWDNTSLISNFAVGPNINGIPHTSGNLLYVRGGQNFMAYSLNGLWAGTPGGTGVVAGDRLSTYTLAGMTDLAMVGNQLMVSSQSPNGLQLADASNLQSLRPWSVSATVNSGHAVASYGNYGVVGLAGGQVAVFELATPRAPHVTRTGSGNSSGITVRPGFIFSGSARVFDLHTSGQLVPDSTADLDGCLWSSVQLDEDVRVASTGTSLVITDLRDSTDRLGSTPWTLAARTTVSLPSGRATGLATVGPFLLAAELRPDGVWLEAFDARALVDRDPATSFAPASSSRGALRLWTGSPANNLRATVSVVNGRAFVAVDASVAPGGVYIVDVRPWLDDVAGGSAVFMGTVPLFSAREATARGDYLYVARAYSLGVANISQAMDENAGTTLPATPPSTSLSLTGTSIAVHGGWAFVNGLSGGLSVVDVRAPLSPRLAAQIAESPTYQSCQPPTSPAMSWMWGNVTVAGTRAYLSSLDALWMAELE